MAIRKPYSAIMAAQEGALPLAFYLTRLCALLVCVPHLALAQDRPIEPFRIGMVVASADAPAVEGLPEIRAMFSRALALPVEVIAARNHEALVAAHIGGRVDYAIYTAVAYAAADRCECVEPIATPMTHDGAIGVRSVLISRMTGELSRIALAAPDSLAGRLAPLGVWPGAEKARSAQQFVEMDSAQEAEAKFVSGDVDAFFGWVPVSASGRMLTGGTPDRLAAAGVGDEEFTIAWQSETLRHGPHAVRSDLPEETREKLVSMLVGGTSAELAYINRAYGGGFVVASGNDYQPVTKALKPLIEPQE